MNDREMLDYLFFAIIFCGVFDMLLIIFSGWNARWFKLHACVNSLIVGLTIDNVYMMIQNPQCGFDKKNTHIDGIFTVALHIYHCLFFKLKTIDYYHHGFSVFIPVLLVPNITYRFNSLYYFTLSGLPGGLDYLALTMVKYDYMDKITEKKVSSLLNSYIRMPLGTIASFYTYTAAVNEKDPIIFSSLSIMCFLIYYNVSYFGKLAIENYGKNKRQLLN
tara:strand:- start:3500 stop:4156 length:657 start_codon:yes stop_codon:yes gene_type:complete